MNRSAAPLAITGRNEWVILSFFIAEADLAVAFLLLCSYSLLDFENAVSLFKMVGVSEGEGLLLIL